jgi:hypothetical protein
MVRLAMENNLRNHRLRLSLAKVKIALDNPLGLYLPYESLCQRFDLKCPESSCGQQGKPRS